VVDFSLMSQFSDILPHHNQRLWWGLPKITFEISWLLSYEVSTLA
jgi:hypothetical protein